MGSGLFDDIGTAARNGGAGPSKAPVLPPSREVLQVGSSEGWEGGLGQIGARACVRPAPGELM